ncbi:hypothetical protein C4569_03140 [Candidatus Parcubacteria bacterium]|nr:MAG: hypothetical protein C4569_03140 [Candidatus Parcubacteria bacterium]
METKKGIQYGIGAENYDKILQTIGDDKTAEHFLDTLGKTVEKITDPGELETLKGKLQNSPLKDFQEKLDKALQILNEALKKKN